ncbi:alpha/beta hydrolase [Rubrivirga sp. IMCC45206]|uniref:alpha/beta hydrolase n=1 Tax=Rubrivirga sp. IMCC45206 TaxID=3391614 RepID=UPI00398F9E8F
MTVRHIAAVKTARYAVLGPEDGPVSEVWLVCHGYGQLAPYFARHFRAVQRPGRLVVVPEALSRFYVGGPGASTRGSRERRVGATWMTREDRQHDIADVVRYLDDVFVAACTRADADPLTVPLVGVGFSQGTAAVARWLALSPLVARRERRARRLVLWGGGLPPDLDLAAHAGWLADAGVTLVAGDRDGFATPARVLEQEARLRDADIPFESISFAGEHRLNDRVLRELA